MRTLLVGGLALLATAAASAQQAQRPPTQPPDRRVDLDFQRYYTAPQLESALQSLSGAYPELLRLESLGKSRGGRELWVVTVAARDGADPGRKSALLLVGGLGGDDLHGVEMALFTLYDLALNHARDERVAKALADTTLYVVPCLDPDLRAALLEGPSDGALAGARAERLDANFPTGWSPWGDGAEGPYPLSEPETRALVDFLAVHPNVAVVQTYSGSVLPARAADAEPAPASDAERHRAVVAAADAGADEEGRLAAWPDLPRRGGALLPYACVELGAYGFVSEVVGHAGPGLPQVQELFGLARLSTHHTLALAASLPRLRFGPAAVQRLKSDLWQVDLELANEGRLPTLSAQAASRRAPGRPRLSLSGARLLAAALREGEQGAYVALPRVTGALAVPELAAGGRLHLRLVVSATLGSTLELAFASPRGGVVQTRVELQQGQPR